MPTIGTTGFDVRGVAGIDWTGALAREALGVGAAGAAAGANGVAAGGAGGGGAGRGAGGGGCVARSAVALVAGTGAINDPADSSPRPTAKLRSAAGEIATRAVANCLNALGSGFTDANSARSASRIGSSTIM